MKKRICLLLVLFLACSESDSDPITITTSDFSITIDENPVIDQILGTLSATTNGEALEYEIIDQNPENSFRIDPVSGVLRVLTVQNFDFELNPSITGVIEVSNASASEMTNVQINLNDQEEEVVFRGEATLTTQEEVDQFGANGYTVLEGTLTISDNVNQGSSPITSLNPLSTITEVENFIISNNSYLTNFSGLDNINRIEGSLVIRGNALIQNLDELSDVRGTGGDLTISDNSSLENIDGFSNFKTTGGSLSITNNRLLSSLSPLSMLIGISESLVIQNNPLVDSFEVFQNINSFPGSVIIEDMPLLASLTGLESLTTIGERLHLRRNDRLENISALSTLISVGQDIVIEVNPQLTTLDGLDNIEAVVNFEVNENTSLSDLCGATNLVQNISGNYNVSNNAFNPSKQDLLDGRCRE